MRRPFAACTERGEYLVFLSVCDAGDATGSGLMAIALPSSSRATLIDIGTTRLKT